MLGDVLSPFSSTSTNGISTKANRLSIFSTPEFSEARHEVNRSWRTWLAVLTPIVMGLTLAALFLFHARTERISEENRKYLEQIAQIQEVVRVQNAESKRDRAHLNRDRDYLKRELENTRASLKRLERAVKTGEYQ